MFNLKGGTEERKRTALIPHHWPMEVGFLENHLLVKKSSIHTNFSLLQ